MESGGGERGGAPPPPPPKSSLCIAVRVLLEIDFFRDPSSSFTVSDIRAGVSDCKCLIDSRGLIGSTSSEA